MPDPTLRTADLPSGPAATRDDTPSPAGSALPAITAVQPRYHLLDEIARGGMGVIYRATDTTLGREVAVKVLQDRYTPDSGIARRFADEARIAAQLQHPGIPPVHDLGTLPDGRPFLAMKLIKGQTLEELLLARPGPSAERGRFVAAFEQVCQALAYAHAHQVIHRDLKPANIMVGAFAEVQVMDWGLAKVLGSGERERSQSDPEATTGGTAVVSLRDSDGSFTQAGSVLGTPAYMPPEQAVGAVGKVDSRSDVFGLGAILAVILTGKPPFASSSAETTRVRAAQGDVADCFARLDGCGAEPELVALCKRCLSPRPADRPADAGEVARAVAALRAAADERARQAELERVRLEGEQAAAETRSAERRKRRRLALAAAMVLAIAVIAGLTAVLLVQRRANAELADEQAKVQARFTLAQKAIATFHTGVSEDVLLKNDQFKELRTRLLKEAARFYSDLEKLLEGQTDAKSRQALGAGYFQLGELTEKIGSQPEALAVHRKALAIRRELAAAAGADVETRLDVARSLRIVGNLLHSTGDTAGAMTVFLEGRDLAERLEAECPTEEVRFVLARNHDSIGWLLSLTGKRAEALAAHEKARTIQQTLADANPAVTSYQSDLSQSHYVIGWLLSQRGKPAEALAAHEKARTLRQKLADANPAVTGYHSALANSHSAVGILLAGAGKPAMALAPFRQARLIRQTLADANPSVTIYQSDLAQSNYVIGVMLWRLGKPAEALEAHREALDIRDKVAEANPTVTGSQSDLAQSCNAIGVILWQTGNRAEGLAAYEKARTIRYKLADANPSVTSHQVDLAQSHNNIGVLLAQMGKVTDALEAHRKARAIFQRLANTFPADPEYQRKLAQSHNNIGRLHARQKQFDEALAALNTGLAIREKLAAAHPTITMYSNHLGYSYAYRGWARLRAGQPAEAAVDLRRALDLWAKDRSTDTEARCERARALALLVGLSGDARSGVTAATAATFADQAVAALRDAIHAGWTQLDELKEPDFDSLRKRADFQKLMKDLEAKKAPHPDQRGRPAGRRGGS